MEKVGLTRKPILYREPGREGKSSGAHFEVVYFYKLPETPLHAMLV